MKIFVNLICICVFPLSTLAQQPRLVLPIGHTSVVISAKFSPDGKRVLTASLDKTAEVWDAQNGKLLLYLKGHTSALNSAEFSPDGSKIVTASEDKTARIWDAQTGNLLHKITGHTLSVISAKFSPDGTKILTVSEDLTAKVWAVRNGHMLVAIKGHTKKINSAEFSPNGKRIVTASEDKTARIWDAQSGKLLICLRGHKSSVSSAKFSPDGKTVFTYELLKGIGILWNSQSGTQLLSLDKGWESIESGEFSHNGEKILTTVYSGSTIWDVQSGTKLLELPVSNFFNNSGKSAKFSPDGGKVITIYSGLPGAVWDARNGALLLNLKEKVPYFSSVDFSPDGERIVSISYNFNALVIDTKNGNLLQDLRGHHSRINSIDFSPDGNKIVTSGDINSKVWDIQKGNLSELKGHSDFIFTSEFSPDGKKIVTASKDQTVKVWDVQSNKLLLDLKGHETYVYSAKFSPDGKKIVTGSGDFSTKVWDAEKGTLLLNIWDPNYNARRAKFSPDGKKILTVDVVLPPRVYDAEKGKLLVELKLKELYTNSAEFSPDGNKIITALYDSTAKVWDSQTGKLLLTLSKHSSHVYRAKYSPDGKRIVTGSDDNTAIIWDALSGKFLHQLLGHFELINGIEFNADSKKILTISYDNTAKVWETESGKLLYELIGHSGALISAKFSPNDKVILTLSDDNTAKIWNSTNGKLIYTFFAIDSLDYFYQIPKGYYMCTRGAAKLLHYVTNDLKVITFDQLDIKYNRPDKVLLGIGCTDTILIKSYKKAYEKRIKKLGIDTTTFRDGYSVPEANFKNLESISYEQINEKMKLQIKYVDKIYYLDRINVWINEVPVYGLNGISIRGMKKHSFDTTLDVTLSQGDNRIETSVLNLNGTESYRSPIVVKYNPVKPKKEKVYFVGIGINQFANSSYNLNWSVKDIRDLAVKLKEHYSDSITIDTLFDQQVTRENVIALKQHLQLLSEDDKVIVAYSGHGVLSKDFDYFLSTYNVSFDHPEINGLPYDDLESLVDGIRPRKKLMLIDACHSGEVDKDEIAKIEQSKSKLDSSGITHKSEITVVPKKSVGMSNSFELMQSLFVNVGKGTGATIISAAGGMQYAQERGDLKNGVFTYSILEAFNNNKTLTVSELKKIVGERVTALTNGLQKPTSRNETINVDWQVW